MTAMFRSVSTSLSRWCALGALVFCAAWSPAHAEDAQPSSQVTEDGTPEVPKIATGDNTRAWLQQQGSRKQASRTRQTLSGPAMSNAYKRHVDSFGQPIPETPLRSTTPTFRQ